MTKDGKYRISAVIAAAGAGRRMGAAVNKVFLPILGREALYYTVKAFADCRLIDEIIIICAPAETEQMRGFIGKYGFCASVVSGGADRQQSVMNGLSAASGDIVCIHDGARCLVTADIIENAVDGCISFGAAAPGVKCKDTLKTADTDGFISGTVDREYTYQIQTPQTFFREDIFAAHKKSAAEDVRATDDCALMERAGYRIKITDSDYDNIKLTTPGDMAAAEAILKKRGY